MKVKITVWCKYHFFGLVGMVRAMKDVALLDNKLKNGGGL
jgi:hypothetical protein